MSVSKDLSVAYRVEDGRKFRLKDFDTGDTGGVSKKLVHAAWSARRSYTRSRISICAFQSSAPLSAKH